MLAFQIHTRALLYHNHRNAESESWHWSWQQHIFCCCQGPCQNSATEEVFFDSAAMALHSMFCRRCKRHVAILYTEDSSIACSLGDRIAVLLSSRQSICLCILFIIHFVHYSFWSLFVLSILSTVPSVACGFCVLRTLLFVLCMCVWLSTELDRTHMVVCIASQTQIMHVWSHT